MSYLEIKAMKHIHVYANFTWWQRHKKRRMANNTAASYPEALNFSKQEIMASVDQGILPLPWSQPDQQERKASQQSIVRHGVTRRDLLTFGPGASINEPKARVSPSKTFSMTCT